MFDRPVFARRPGFFTSTKDWRLLLHSSNSVCIRPLEIKT